MRGGLLAGASALRMSHQVGEALVPVMIGYVVDQAIAPGSERQLVIGLAGLGLVFAVLSWSYRLGARAGVRVAAEAGHDIRLRMIRRVLQPYGTAGVMADGEVLAISTSDADQVAGISGLIIYCAASVAALTTAAIALFSTSWKLGVLVLAGAPILLALVSVLSGPMGRRSSAEQAGIGQASAVAADLVTGLRVLKGIRAEDAGAERYRQASQASLGATLRAAYAEAGLEAATATLGALFLAAVAWVGGGLALSGEISIGGFIAAFGLAQFIAAPMSVLSIVGPRIAQAVASARRVTTVLEQPPAIVQTGSGSLPHGPGRLELRDLVVEEFAPLSFTVEPESFVGVAIDNSGHARALAECLGRQIDIGEGGVYLDGRAYGEIDVEALRRLVVYAGHDATLFGNTVSEVLGGADREWSGHVLEAVRVDEVITALGDHDRIGFDGSNLSGGQRQRLLLAQALVTDPPILVAHDPTTAIDPVTEDGLADGLRSLRAGRTTILITTSPILLSHCDEVIFVENGGLAVATHDELVTSNDAYRKLVHP